MKKHLKKLIRLIKSNLTLIIYTLLLFTAFVFLIDLFLYESEAINQNDINKIVEECSNNKGSVFVEYDNKGNISNVQCYYQNYDEMMKAIKGDESVK